MLRHRMMVLRLIQTTVLRFTRDQLANLDPTAVGGFSKDQLGNLDPTAVGGLTPDQINHLDPIAVGGFSSEQLAGIDPAAFAGFDRDQVDHLDPTALGGVSGRQIDSLNPAAFAGFDKNQLGFIPLDAIDNIDADQIQQLDHSAVGGLSTEQFQTLDPTALGGFTRDNLGGLDEDVIRNLDSNDLQNLNPTEIQNLPSDDFARLVTNLSDATITPDAVVLTTDAGYQIPLLPTARDPEEILLLLPGAKVDVDRGGGTTITLPDAEGGTTPVVGVFDLLFETSDEPPGFYRQGTGADEEILLVYSDGTAQRMRPTIQSPDEFEQTLNAIPGVESLRINMNGTIDLGYLGTSLVLRPLFDITPGTGDGSLTPELIIEGDRFFFSDSNGNRQEFVVGS